MKITRSKLKQIIKEELENVFKESAVAPPGQKQLEQLLASVGACIAAGGLMVGLKCGPYSLALADAILNQKWFDAMAAAKKLQACVPAECAESMKQVLAIIEPFTRAN
jgi:hypothetical protein